MVEWRKKEKKMKGRREIGEVDARQVRSARWRKRKNLSVGHEEWRSEE